MGILIPYIVTFQKMAFIGGHENNLLPHCSTAAVPFQVGHRKNIELWLLNGTGRAPSSFTFCCIVNGKV